MMKTIIVGDITPDLSVLGNQFNATFVDRTNIAQSICGSGNYYISLGDVGYESLISLLDTASHIIIQQKSLWSSYELQSTTTYICRSYNHRVPVDGIDFYNNMFSYADRYNKPGVPTLWTFGGSTVLGVGLSNPESETFSYHLGKLLNLNVINTSKGGAGLRRSLEILSHCEIQQGDYVVLDPTSQGRMRIYENGEIKDTHLSRRDKFTVLSVTDDQLFYDFISMTDTFLKICSLSGANTVFYSNMHQTKYSFEIENHFSRYSSWSLKASHLINSPLDLGTDQGHPGAKTHYELAQILYQHLTNENSYIR